MHTIEDKDVVFFTTTLLTQFYVRFDISLHSFRGGGGFVPIKLV